MASKNLNVRLQPDEWAMLARICDGETTRNSSEMVRLLIHREHARRTTGKSVVDDKAVASDWRLGRPKSAPSVEPT